MIDQRFLDDLAQDLRLPEDAPTEEMQLASANTGVTTDGGAFVGYRLNMPKGLNTPENQAKQSALIANTLGGGALGGTAAGVGLTGDIIDIILMGANALGADMPEKSGVWTTEDVTSWLASKGINQENISGLIDKALPSGSTEEEKARAFGGGQTVGELAAPGTQLSLIGKAGKEIVKGGAKIGKKIIEAGKDLPVGMSIKGVDESLDPLGFYSAASKAVDNIAQEKGTGQQFLAQIEKTPGVKKEELLWTGLDDFLKGKKSVTKAEVQEYLNANRVEVKEVTLNEGARPYRYVTANEWQGAIDDAERVGNFDEAERITAAWENFELGGGAGKPKFAKYTLPGGENYREVLLTLPTRTLAEAEARVVLGAKPDAKLNEYDIDFASRKKANEFKSQHFDQPNILAHMRLNDRVDADGKKVLFVEEVQSDWHQAGRKKGYQIKQAPQDLEIRKTENGYGVFDKNRNNLISEHLTEEKASDSMSRVLEARPTTTTGVPDAPFKGNWHELAMKRAIQLASEGGYDRIAFTTGKTQAERYDLSKQIENIQYNQKTKFLFGEDKNGRIVVDEIVEPEKLDEYIGKEAANKLLSDESIIARTKDGKPFLHELSGQQLQVGGEGMKGFYDTILPKYLDKYGKKWDAKTGMTKIRLATDAQDTADSKLLKDLGMDEGGKATASVHYMDITPKMKESVLTKGQPLFQMAPAIPAGAAGTQMQEENK